MKIPKANKTVRIITTVKDWEQWFHDMPDKGEGILLAASPPPAHIREGLHRVAREIRKSTASEPVTMRTKNWKTGQDAPRHGIRWSVWLVGEGDEKAIQELQTWVPAANIQWDNVFEAGTRTYRKAAQAAKYDILGWNSNGHRRKFEDQ